MLLLYGKAKTFRSPGGEAAALIEELGKAELFRK
jgi:hypothetical protein